MEDWSNWPVLGSFPAFFMADDIHTTVLVFPCPPVYGGLKTLCFSPGTIEGRAK